MKIITQNSIITANINVYNSRLSFLRIYVLLETDNMKPKHKADTVMTAE